MKKFFALMLTTLVVGCFMGCNKEEEPNSLIGDGTGRTPTAAFHYTRHASFTVDFENQSEDATEYKWDFGDGCTSTEVSPSHTYTSRGTKYVTLKAYNGIANVSTAYANINMSSYIKMVNTSNNTYKVYVDGIDEGNITSDNERKYEVNPGEHTVKVVQQNGYTLWPTEETYNFTCTAGYEYTKEFPVSPLGIHSEKVSNK